MNQTTRILAAAVVVLFLVGGAEVAAQQEQTSQQDTLQQARFDVPGGYSSASELTGLPQLVPGLGILFVKQENVPVGPYLAYSPDGELLSSVLLVPAGTEQGAEGMPPTGEDDYGDIELEEKEIDHAELRFNRGFSAARSALGQPHYQVILWHVSPERAREIDELGVAQRQEGRAIGEPEGEDDVGGEEEELEGLTTRDMLTGRTTEDIEPPEGFEAAAEVAQLPEFIPGVGFLYADPENAPLGPYVAYDYDAALVSTVLMVPMDAMTDRTIEDLQLEENEIEFVEVELEQGIEGAASPLDRPHYRVILWHVPAADARLEVGG